MIASDEVLRWGCCGHKIEKRSILFIAQRRTGALRDHKLCFGSDRRKKVRRIHPCTGKGQLEFGAVHDGVKFREGGRTHDQDEAAL